MKLFSKLIFILYDKGIGFGILSTISFATFNKYFVRRRLLMMGLAQTLVCIGSMTLPLLIVLLLGMFGFRGCLLVLSAINGHMVVAMMVMHPVEWHAKRCQPKLIMPFDVEGKNLLGILLFFIYSLPTRNRVSVEQERANSYRIASNETKSCRKSAKP